MNRGSQEILSEMLLFVRHFELKTRHDYLLYKEVEKLVSRDKYSVTQSGFCSVVGARCTITIIKIFIYPVISAIFRIFLNKPLESKRNSMQNRDPTIQKWIHIYIYLYNDVNATRSVIGRCPWSIRVQIHE